MSVVWARSGVVVTAQRSISWMVRRRWGTPRHGQGGAPPTAGRGIVAGVRGFVSRLERFGSVPSTQPIVREWLEQGTPEVAIAVADEQTSGRGRLGRTWTAPPGSALLVSAGFRPLDLPAAHAWRLAATVSL